MPVENLEAEKMLMGCILLDNSIIRELEVQPKHMSIIHAHILKAMKEIDEKDEQINAATLFEKLGENVMAQIDIEEMINAVASSSTYGMYQAIILRTWKKMKVKNLANDLINMDDTEIDEATLSEFITNVNELEEIGVQSDDFNLKELLFRIVDKAQTGTVKQGVKTGFHEYDRMTNGHIGGKYYLIAARPSVGKTAFAINISLAHMTRDAFGHIYSLEMGEEELVNRMISAIGNIDSMKMRDPLKRFDENDWNSHTMSVAKIHQMNMYICDNSTVKLSEIRARTRKLMRKYPDKNHFIVIDYLQLMTPSKRSGNRQEDVSEMSREIKVMARELDIPVIVLSQLSRGVESRQDKRPMLSDIRESGSIEQDADLVTFLYRDDYYDKESGKKDIIEIIISKQREGPTGTVELAFVKEYNKFVNLERRFSE